VTTTTRTRAGCGYKFTAAGPDVVYCSAACWAPRPWPQCSLDSSASPGARGMINVAPPRYLVGTQSREVAAVAAAARNSHPHLVEATAGDLRESIRRAEQRSGFTYDQLARQARTGNFASFQARLAWVAVGGLREITGP
jgi:hypothetical protein